MLSFSSSSSSRSSAGSAWSSRFSSVIGAARSRPSTRRNGTYTGQVARRVDAENEHAGDRGYPVEGRQPERGEPFELVATVGLEQVRREDGGQVLALEQ